MPRIFMSDGKINPKKMYFSKAGWTYGNAELLTMRPGPNAQGDVPTLDMCLLMLQAQQQELLGPGVMCIDLVDPDEHVIPWKGYIWFDVNAIDEPIQDNTPLTWRD